MFIYNENPINPKRAPAGLCREEQHHADTLPEVAQGPRGCGAHCSLGVILWYPFCPFVFGSGFSHIKSSPNPPRKVALNPKP